MMAGPVPSLADLGWTVDRELAFAPFAASGLIPGRVVAGGNPSFAFTALGPTEVVLQRRALQSAGSSAGSPTVGDWLALETVSDTPPRAALREILARSGTFARHRPFDGTRQVLAANVDVALVVAGLDHDLNLRRLERYLVLALEGAIRPVVVLNKADLAVDLGRIVADVHGIAPGTRVVVTSATEGTGLDELREIMAPGLTACLLGSSGVGKSTITNALLGEARQAVRASREADSKGRHATTRRELVWLPGRGLLLDTPGLRTVGVLGSEETTSAAFEDVASFARHCRFRDCRHHDEPGCAVQAAIETGQLSAARLQSHDKLESERAYADRREDVRARRAQERHWGRQHRHVKQALQRRQRGEA